MRILITGASGFLGSHLAASLAREGHELVLVSRRSRPGFLENHAWQEMDLLASGSLPRLTRLCDQVDRVVMLAARLPFEAVPGSLLEANRRMDRLTAEAFIASKAAGALYLSGLTVFPPDRGSVVDENTPPRPARRLLRLQAGWRKGA